MKLKKGLLGLILVLFLFPSAANAEIATVKDWIGLFPQNTTSYGKTNTYHGCPGLADGYCWFYTSSSTCNQTAGTTPRLTNTTPTCFFNFNPLPPTGYYVFRLMANDDQTIDGLIAASKLMYTNATASATLTPTPTPVAASGKLYRVTGDLTLNSDITVNETGVIFVDGNLYIKTNILNAKSTKGLVFVVKGSIFIRRDVTQVNAFLISHGKSPTGDDITPFCSAWDDGTLPIAHAPSAECDDFSGTDIALRQYLSINGSVISLNPNPLFPPKFKREKNDPSGTIPAETVNYEPKYLVIMKDIFSRDLRIWREIQ